MKERLAAKRSGGVNEATSRSPRPGDQGFPPPAKQPPLRASAPVQEQQAEVEGKGGLRTPVIYLDDSEEVCHHDHVFHAYQIMGLYLRTLCVYFLSAKSMRIPSSFIVFAFCAELCACDQEEEQNNRMDANKKGRGGDVERRHEARQMPSSPTGKKPAKKQALAERSLNSPDVAIPKLADTSKRVGGKMKLPPDGKAKPRTAAAAAVPMAHRSIEMVAGKRTAGTAQAATGVQPCPLCGKSGFDSQVQLNMHVEWCLEQRPPASRGADGALGDQEVARRNHAGAEESSHTQEGAGDHWGCSSKQKQGEALEGQTSGKTTGGSSSRQGVSTSNNSKTGPSGGNLKGRDVGGSVKQSIGIAHTAQQRQQPAMHGRSSTKEDMSSSKRLDAAASNGNAEKSGGKTGRGGGRLALNKGVRAVDPVPRECAAEGMGEPRGGEDGIRGRVVVGMSAVRVEKEASGGNEVVGVDVAPTCRVGGVLKDTRNVEVAQGKQLGAISANAHRQVGDVVAPAKDGDRRGGIDVGASRQAMSVSRVGRNAVNDQVVAGGDDSSVGVQGAGLKTSSEACRGDCVPMDLPTVAEGEGVKGKKRRLQLHKATTPSSKKQQHQQQQQPESPIDKGGWVSSASPAAMATQGSSVASQGNGAVAAPYGRTSHDESTLLPRSLELELLGMGIVELSLPVRGEGWLGEDWREELVREGSREGGPAKWIQGEKGGDATSSSSSSRPSSKSAPDFDFMETGSGWGELANCVARPFVIT